MASDSHEPPRWRYLSSAHIEVPVSSHRLDVRDRKNKRIGNFDGVIIDPAADRVRYLVVDAAGWFRHQRYLLPMDPTQMDVEQRALRVDLDSSQLDSCEKFDSRVFPDFSDDRG